jgi:hypothetical protein
MIKNSPCAVPQVTALVLIAFLFHLRTVALSFLYRTPGRRRANDWTLVLGGDTDVVPVLGGASSGRRTISGAKTYCGSAQRMSGAFGLCSGENQIVPSVDVWENPTAAEAVEWERRVRRAEQAEMLWFS